MIKADQQEQNAINKMRAEHKRIVDNIALVLATPPGKVLAKYLIRELDVAKQPELGLEGTMLSDKIGFLRAGSSIFNIFAQANPEVTGALLAQIMKEEQDELIYQETLLRQTT